MKLSRILRHAFTFQWQTRQRLPAASLEAVQREIAASERLHGGEIRVIVESRLEPSDLWAGLTPRQRAQQLFALHRVWDTELNNGVLIYVLMADRDVEIVADRGFNGRVDEGQWEEVCRQMETEFRAGRFEAGTLAAVRAAGELIARHFPAVPGGGNELPDAPVLA